MAALTTAIILGTLAAAQTTKGVIDARNAARGARKLGNYEGQMLDKQAADALARGEESAQQTDSQARILTGAQRTALAAQGIDIESGSAADVVSSDQRQAQIDEHQQIVNAAREAFGFTEQGRLARMGAKNQARSYNNQATSTVLAGAASLYDVYHSYKLNKVPRTTPPQQSGTGRNPWDL